MRRFFADVRLSASVAAGGAISFAIAEYLVTLWAYAGHIHLANKLRFTALVVTLSVLLWFVLTVATIAVIVAARCVQRLIGRTEAAPLHGFVVASPPSEVRSGVPRLWASVMTAGLLGLLLQQAAASAIGHFKEPQLTGALVAAMAIVVVAVGIPL